MYLKILLLSLLFFASCPASFAQHPRMNQTDKHFHESTEMPDVLIASLRKLDSTVTSFFGHQKAKRLDRELGYFKADLRDYLQVRYSIMTLLEQHNYLGSDFVYEKEGAFILKGGMQTKVHELELRLQKLMERSKKLGPYFDANSEIADDLPSEFYVVGQEQAVSYLYELDEIFQHKTVDKHKVRLEGRVIYQKLKKCLDLIAGIQQKLAKL